MDKGLRQIGVMHAFLCFELYTKLKTSERVKTLIFNLTEFEGPLHGAWRNIAHSCRAFWHRRDPPAFEASEFGFPAGSCMRRQVFPHLTESFHDHRTPYPH